MDHGRNVLRFDVVVKPCKHLQRRAVVVTLLVERLLLTPEIRGSNPVSHRQILFTINCIGKSKKRKKRPEKRFLRIRLAAAVIMNSKIQTTVGAH